MNETELIWTAFNESLDNAPVGVPAECYSKISGSIVYNAECIIKHLCPQISSYFIYTGLVIICLVIGLSRLLQWYLRKGYLAHPLPSNFIYISGDMQKLETRLYWEHFVMMKLLKLCCGYIAVVIWLNL